MTDAPEVETIRDCAHARTRAAAQPRWRSCLDCGQLVHRAETRHYADLFVPPRPLVKAGAR